MSDQWGTPDQQPNQVDQFGQPLGAPAPQQFGAPGAFDQNQYPQAGYAQPGYPQPGYGMPPQKQSNGLAIAGLILAILVWPVGLILSIIALVKSKGLGGAGKTPAIIGLIISLILGAGTVALVAVAAKSTAADPGCISAESSINDLTPKLTADESKLSADSGNSTATQADLTTLIADMQSVKTDLDNAEGLATHDSVKAAIGKMDTDLGTFLTGMQAIESGDSSNATQTMNVANQLGPDGQAVDNLCSSL